LAVPDDVVAGSVSMRVFEGDLGFADTAGTVQFQAPSQALVHGVGVLVCLQQTGDYGWLEPLSE
jgi:hypothetical protein